MATKRKGAVYYTWTAEEKATIVLYLNDCWLMMQRERESVEDKAIGSGLRWHVQKLTYLQTVESYLRQRYSYIGATPPGEGGDSNTDQPSSSRTAGKGRD